MRLQFSFSPKTTRSFRQNFNAWWSILSPERNRWSPCPVLTTTRRFKDRSWQTFIGPTTGYLVGDVVATQACVPSLSPSAIDPLSAQLKIVRSPTRWSGTQAFGLYPKRSCTPLRSFKSSNASANFTTAYNSGLSKAAHSSP